MDPPQAQTPVYIKSSMRSNRGSGGGLGGELDLQTEVVTVSHRTICANDMFQSVSAVCWILFFFFPYFCPKASCMYKLFYLLKLLGLSYWDCRRKKKKKKNFHNSIQPSRHVIQLTSRCFAICAISVGIMLIDYIFLFVFLMQMCTHYNIQQYISYL